MTAQRPLAILEVDGVLVLDDPVVPVVRTVVHAAGHKWARTVDVPAGADEILAELAARFDIVWAGAWSHNAHPALRGVLGLPEGPWPFLPVQFHKLPAIQAYSAGRPWVWIDDGIHDLAPVEPPAGGILVPVDARRGITAVDPELLYRSLMQSTSVEEVGP